MFLIFCLADELEVVKDELRKTATEVFTMRTHTFVSEHLRLHQFLFFFTLIRLLRSLSLCLSKLHIIRHKSFFEGANICKVNLSLLDLEFSHLSRS